MNCFVHEGASAVGICRGCGKGVCRACARDLGSGLACSDACAGRVADVESINRKAGTTYRMAQRNVWLAPGYLGIFGLIMLWFGFRDWKGFNFLVAIGALFIVFSIVVWIRNRRWAREMDQER